MTFDWSDAFTVTQPEQFGSIFVAGILVGFLFAARMSAHLTVWAFGFRTAVIGVVFLAGMMLSRAIGGAEHYEVWAGIIIAFVVYSAGLMLGIIGYDWQFKRAVERQLGRPLDANPRGVIDPAKLRRRGER